VKIPEITIYFEQEKGKRHIIRSVCEPIFTIYFEQEKGKRINISPTADNIEVSVFIYQKRPPIIVRFPKSWKIEYESLTSIYSSTEFLFFIFLEKRKIKNEKYESLLCLIFLPLNIRNIQ